MLCGGGKTSAGILNTYQKMFQMKKGLLPAKAGSRPFGFAELVRCFGKWIKPVRAARTAQRLPVLLCHESLVDELSDTVRYCQIAHVDASGRSDVEISIQYFGFPVSYYVYLQGNCEVFR